MEGQKLKQLTVDIFIKVANLPVYLTKKATTDISTRRVQHGCIYLKG